MAEDGNKGAQRAVSLQADPTWALSTIQVGITSIGILSGIVGESALAGPAAEVLVGWGVSPETAKVLGVTLVVVFVTYFSICLLYTSTCRRAPERRTSPENSHP